MLFHAMSKWLVLAVGIAIGGAAGWTAALATRNAGADAVSGPNRESAPAVSKTAASASPAPATSVDIQRLANGLDEPFPLPSTGAAADVAALERLLEESNSLPAAERQRTRFAAYLRYAALDPQAAVDRLLGAGDADDTLLWVAFTAWAMHDPDAALRRAESLSPRQRKWASSVVWSVSAREDPQRAWQETLASKSGKARTEALRSIAHFWAAAAPAEALAAIDALPEAPDKKSLRTTVLFMWMEKDQGTALQWAQQQQPEAISLMPVLLRLMDDSPAEAIELAMATDAKDRQMAVMQVIHNWARSDPRATFEWILRNQSSLHDVALAAEPLREIAETAPRQALALAKRLDKTRRRLAISAILERWASYDAPAAAAWLDSSSTELESARVAAIAAAYARQRGEEAFDWVSTQPSAHQGRAMSTIAGELAERSPQRALRLAQRIDDPQQYRKAISSIVSAWASEDPQAARRWIAANAEDGHRAALFSRLYVEWAYVDQAEAAANVLRHGDRSERDAALAATATTVARKNPDLAERLYAEIQGDEQRRSVARYFAASWRRTDPGRAERYRDER